MYQYNKYKAKVKRVVDGDTVDLEIDLGFHVVIRERGRLLNVDTPERGHHDWARATETFGNLLSKEADGGGYINVTCSGKGKYGRWLIDIENVNSVLAEEWPYER